MTMFTSGTVRCPGGCADRYFFDNFGRQYLWIIGQTGSAKSTLIQLIPRLYDATRGEVRIDGIPVRKYPMEHLRDAIAVVLQKNTLFSGTLLENLRWGKEDGYDGGNKKGMSHCLCG